MALVGSGSLTREIAFALARLGPRDLTVALIARNPIAARNIVSSATESGQGVTFTFDHVPVFSTAGLAVVLRRLRPVGVLMCASTQSPWERFTAPSAWTDLIEQAGFGLTLPFHADLAATAGLAVAEACPSAWYLNACFPDAVNPVLLSGGVPVFAGIGNVATIADTLVTSLGVTSAEQLHVLGHHLHLSTPKSPDREARVWFRGRETTGVSAMLTGQRSTYRPDLNATTGRVTAEMLGDLLDGRTAAGHLPGPAGLPGGYPVTIGPDGVELRLPPGLSAADAIACNLVWAAYDGVTVERNTVTFADRVTAAVEPELADISGPLRIEDLDELRQRLDVVRGRLRALPSTRIA